MERRLKRVFCHPSLISEFLGGWEGGQSYKIETDFPEDVTVVGCYWDQMRQVPCFVCQHPDWPEVMEGSIIQECTPTYRHVYPDA